MLWLDRNAARYVWTSLFLIFATWLLFRIRETIFIFVLALLFAYLLWPLVNLLDRHMPGRSRVPALTLVYLVLVGVLIVLGVSIGTRVAAEATALAAKLPDILARIHQTASAPGAGPHGAELTIRTELENQVAKHSQQLLAMLPGAALGALARARSLIFVVLVPILSFFFLKDSAELRNSILGLLGDGSQQEKIKSIAGDVHVLLAQYMRALVLLGLVAAFAYGLFFTLMRVPYPILLAAIAFPLEFIPMVGPLAGGAIVLLVAGLSGSGHLLALFLFLVLFRGVQDYVISPHLMSTGMKLHPLLVIFGVLAGASIAGVPGAFLSVPVLATLRIVIRRVLGEPAAN